MHIQILNGDATQIEADALVTLINSGKMWFGGMDGAIQRAGGSQFHAQASTAIDRDSLHDGDVIYAPGAPANGKFKAIIFVIDDLQCPVNTLVVAALDCAVQHNCRTVTMPALRTGVAAGSVEKTVEETVGGIFKGIEAFNVTHPDIDLTLTFALYHDPNTERLLAERLRLSNTH